MKYCDEYVSLIISVGQSVCQSVQWVNCGKTDDWIWMFFGVVNGVGREMDVLYAGGDHRRVRGNFGGKCGYPIITSKDFVAWLFSAMRGGDAALPKLL